MYCIKPKKTAEIKQSKDPNIKPFLFLSLILLPLWSESLKELKSYQANFTQTLTDEAGSRIIYKGVFYAKYPGFALWHYDEPIAKDVYITQDEVTIVEPELEQVIHKKNDTSFTLFTILKEAKQLNETTYTHTIQDTVYTLISRQTLIQNLSYKDPLGNNILIEFSKQYPDKKLKTALFHAKFPSDFDIITE